MNPALDSKLTWFVGQSWNRLHYIPDADPEGRWWEETVEQGFRWAKAAFQRETGRPFNWRNYPDCYLYQHRHGVTLPNKLLNNEIPLDVWGEGRKKEVIGLVDACSCD